MFKFTSIITATITIFLCFSFERNKKSWNDEKPNFSKDSLAKHISILASDSSQGRKPFSSGETRTVDYLQKTFTAMGLEPGNGSSFIQEVHMVKITPTPDPVMKVEGPSGNIELLYRTWKFFLISEMNWHHPMHGRNG